MVQKNVMLAAGIGAGLVVLYLIGKNKDKTGAAPVAESLGRGAVEAAIGAVKGGGGAVIDAIKGAGKAVTAAVYPLDECVKAMRAGDSSGVAWHCTAGTFVDWLTSGKPRGCYLMGDGKIYCTSGWSAGGASGTW